MALADFPISHDTSAVECTRIAHRFARTWALRGVSLRVERGEVLGLVGRNGSGKSTLMRIIATALRPTRGTGRVYGADLARDAGAVRARTALLGHAPGLYEDLTPVENLRFAMRMAGLEADERTIRGMLDEVGLQVEATQRVRHLSAGQQRRVALARVLLRPVRLLLLDEPYTSFDAEGVACVNAVLRAMRARGDAAIVITHDLARAAGVIDRVVQLEGGRVAEGSLAEVGSAEVEPGVLSITTRLRVASHA